jgi:hypothetical protein
MVYFMPQQLGSSGAHVGTGNILVRATVTLFVGVAEVICVVAATPVRTRVITKAFAIFFIGKTPGIRWQCGRGN